MEEEEAQKALSQLLNALTVKSVWWQNGSSRGLHQAERKSGTVTLFLTREGGMKERKREGWTPLIRSLLPGKLFGILHFFSEFLGDFFLFLVHSQEYIHDLNKEGLFCGVQSTRLVGFLRVFEGECAHLNARPQSSARSALGNMKTSFHFAHF